MTKHDNGQSRSDPTSGAASDLPSLATLGLGALAYIRPIIVDGNAAFAVHAADGQSLAVFGDRELAATVIRQNDLQPLSVH